MRLAPNPRLALFLLALSASAAAAERPPLLVTAGGATRLELADGARVALPPLPQGARLESTAALAHGWLAAGTVPARPPNQGGTELLLVAGESGGAATVLPNPLSAGRLHGEPLPLVADGRLAGLVWLEGDTRRSLAVRFAAWTGSAWEEPRLVSPPGPGSQLALTSALLADGSFLLAWSAFDGHDDEIVSARRSADGRWSAPRRVAADNDVPDVTPALTATGGGALLAWSRYTPGLGQYQIVVSRYRDGRFEAPRAVGPAGSEQPGFEPTEPTEPGTGAAAHLLYRTAAPAGWEVLELDGAGRPARAAAIRAAADAGRSAAASLDPVPAGGRPILARSDRGTATLRWPAAEVERSAAWTAWKAPAVQEVQP